MLRQPKARDKRRDERRHERGTSGRYKAGLIGLAALAMLAIAPGGAAQPRSLALLDFELIDEMRAYTGEPERRETERRLALVSAELARQLERRGLYRVLDRAPAAQLIERLRSSYDLHACNGCELDIAKALGAERVAVCWVQKVSNLILNLNIEVRSVAGGETVYAKSVDIRGNTDESWLRGVRRLADNIEERGLHLR